MTYLFLNFRIEDYVRSRNIDLKENGVFMALYSDFRKVFNTIHTHFDFTENKDIGIRFYDMWTSKEFGLFPPEPNKNYANKKDEIERFNWAKNPQYYFAPAKTTYLYIKLSLQVDGIIYIYNINI